MTLSPPSSRLVDNRAYLQALALLAQNFEREGAHTGSATVSGTIYYCSLWLDAMTVTNCHMLVSTAGVAVTTSKMGLYNKDAVLLGASADQGTDWQSTGVKTAALATPVVITTSDLYYVALIAIATTTQPSLLRNTAQAVAAGVVGTGKRPYGNQTGQTDLVDPGTIGGSAPIGYWVGVS